MTKTIAATIDPILLSVYARTFKSMSDKSVAALLARTSDAAASGGFELSKAADRFDGTAHNPHWLGGSKSLGFAS